MVMAKGIFILLILLIIIYELFFFLLGKGNQLKQLEVSIQKKREELQTDLKTKRTELKAKTDELEKKLQDQEKNLKNQMKELKKAISDGRRIGRFQATLFWFLVFSLSFLFFKDIKKFFLLNQNNQIIKTINSVQNAQSNKNYSLTVNPVPSNSTIKIMNIKPKYTKGISLEPGQYVIKVEHPDYPNRYQCVTIKDEDVSIEVPL